jgi:predicted negative regulator of RcsB-dependent stress response
MAFEVLDEHEQGELVQKWLRENAMSIAIGIALGLLLIFGWQQWKVHRVRQATEAATQYQALLDAVNAKRNDDATTIAEALRKQFPDTAYAAFASMRAAEINTSKGDLKAAATDLEWAQQHAEVPALKALAAINLARIKLGQNEADAALKLVDALPKGDYAALAGELRGDILVKLARNDEARAAYQEALGKLESQAPNRSFVQMKLDNLAATPVPAAVATKESSGS